MIEQIKAKAKELLQSKAVDCVIGYERATDGLTARPFFAYQPEETDRLIFDQTCVHNLSKYLLNRKGKVTAIVAKPCDARAIILLINEKQLERQNVYIIGVACSGVVETRWGKAGDKPQPKCQACPQSAPPLYDFLVGEPQPKMPAKEGRFQAVAELEGKTPEEREKFWAEQFQRCIRCYACRNVCPGCYCTQCFAESLDPLWLGIRISPPDKWMWNTVRAYHLAARCIDCGECQRVCPVNIPLMLLNQKLGKEVEDLFHYQPGMDPEAAPPFVTFLKEEHLGIG